MVSGTPTQFISLDRLAPRLGLTDIHKARDTVRRLAKDGLISENDFRSHSGPKATPATNDPRVKNRARANLKASGDVGGRPAVTYFLSPVGALTLAMHVRTPEAAAWRRAQVMKLAGSSAPTASRHEPEHLAVEVQELRARVERLEAAPVKQIPARAPKLAVGELQAAVIAAFEHLLSPYGIDGLRMSKVFELVQLGDGDGAELRAAVRAANNGQMPANAAALGRFLQRICGMSETVHARTSTGKSRRWVVAAKGVH